jgi:hypothetical protein
LHDKIKRTSERKELEETGQNAEAQKHGRKETRKKGSEEVKVTK